MGSQVTNDFQVWAIRGNIATAPDMAQERHVDEGPSHAACPAEPTGPAAGPAEPTGPAEGSGGGARPGRGRSQRGYRSPGSAGGSAARITSARWTPSAPVPWAIWVRHEKPSASTIVPSAALRIAGNSSRSPRVCETS